MIATARPSTTWQLGAGGVTLSTSTLLSHATATGTEAVTTTAAPRTCADTDAGLGTVDDVRLASRHERKSQPHPGALRCWPPRLPRAMLVVQEAGGSRPA